MREELEQLEKTGNFFDNQQKLKDVSDQQLISYMLRPPDEPPQFQILSELNRRKRVRMDQARAEAANTPTVAQEAIAAAGMPMGSVTQMAQAMAPKTSMTENTGIAAMMPKQPTRMATGGVVKMQEAGSVEEQIQKVMAEARADPNSITNTFAPAMIEMALAGRLGEDRQKFAVQIAIEGGYGLDIQRDVLSKALAGEYGDEIKEGAERARGVLEQSGLRGFKPEGSQLASTAATAETVVPEFKSGLRGFTPTDTQLAPTASTAETVAPQLKSGLRGFEPTGNQLAPMGAVAEVVEPAKFPTIQAGAGIRGADTKPARELAELLGGRQLLPGVDLPGPSTTYEIDPTAALKAGEFLTNNLPPEKRTPDPLTRNETLLQDLIAQNQALIPGANVPRQQTFLDNQPQDAENLRPLSVFDPQGLNQQREDRDKNLANEIAARGREDELSTFPVRNVFQDNQPQDPFDAAVGEIAGIGSTNFKTATALEAENQDREDSLSTFPVRNVFQDNQPQVGDPEPESEFNFSTDPTKGYPDPGGGLESYFGTTESNKIDPYNAQTLLQAAKQTSNFADLVEVAKSTARGKAELAGGIPSDELSFEPFNNTVPKTFLDNQPQTKEDIIEGETTAVINSAANTLANDVGGDALGARGPEAAKAAQQGLDKRMWMRIAMYGLIASEGTAKARSEAAKTFLAMDAKDKALETKERIAIGDRESREKTTNARVDATLKSIEQRRTSAAAKNNLTALQDIQEYLQGELLLVSNPMGGPKEGAINADAYNRIRESLNRVVSDIAKIGGTSLAAYDADKLYQDDIDVG